MIGGCTVTESSSRSRNARWPRTASSRETTSSSEPLRSAAKMTCTTCLRPAARGGEIESTIATGPSSGTSASSGNSPVSSQSSRVSARDEALARSHAAARKEPDRFAASLVASEKDPSAPTEDCGDPDPRFGHVQLADDPKPRAPRSLVASSSTSTSRTDTTGATTSWAIRIPGSTTNAASRSELIRTTRISPR